MQTYSAASLQVSQAIEKTLASEQEKAKWRNDAPSEYRFATSDPRFGVEGTQLFTRLLSERLRALASSPGAAPPSSSAAVLSLTAGLPTQPGSPSPLAGITMYLMKESFASILTKSGIRAAPGGSVIESWGAACDRHAPECAQAMNATAPYITNKVKFDVYGNAKFPAVPSATYDVFGWTLYNGHHLAWDLQVDLKPGANTIVLDQRNAIALK